MANKKQTWTERFMKAVFYFGILLTGIVPVIVGLYFKDPSTIWVAALCGAFISFIAKFEELAELTLGPVKAKMKAQIAEVNATAEQLQAVAATMAEGFLAELCSGRFIGGLNLKSRMQLRDKVILSLSNIGVSEDQIKKVDSYWSKGISIEYVGHIAKELEKERGTKPIEEREPYTAAVAAINKQFNAETWDSPTPAVIKAILDLHNAICPKVDEWLDDYGHYLASKEIRNQAAFFKE